MFCIIGTTVSTNKTRHNWVYRVQGSDCQVGDFSAIHAFTIHGSSCLVSGGGKIKPYPVAEVSGLGLRVSEASPRSIIPSKFEPTTRRTARVLKSESTPLRCKQRVWEGLGVFSIGSQIDSYPTSMP